LNLKQQIGKAQKYQIDASEFPKIGNASDINTAEMIVFFEPLSKESQKYFGIWKSLAKKYKDRLSIYLIPFPQDVVCNPEIVYTPYKGSCAIAAASYAAYKQNKYMEFWEALYSILSEEEDVDVNDEFVRNVVNKLDVDQEKYQQDFDSKARIRFISHGIDAINSTGYPSKDAPVGPLPAIFINGKILINNLFEDADDFSKVIEQEINE
jgi:hypothetical protein